MCRAILFFSTDFWWHVYYDKVSLQILFCLSFCYVLSVFSWAWLKSKIEDRRMEGVELGTPMKPTFGGLLDFGCFITTC